MDNQLTATIFQKPEDYLGKPKPQRLDPRLFVVCEHEIMEFVLSGKQTIGRPSSSWVPDIPIINKYVSRHHGVFETNGTSVTFTAGETTNSTVFRRKILEPGETVEIWDGDEMVIPLEEDGTDIMLVCAILESRIQIWQEMRQASKDALTGLSGRNSFRTWYIQNIYWREESNVCLFIMDVDYFKEINDNYGHTAGDAALKMLSELLVENMKGVGYACRWGGDEFVGVIREDHKTAGDILWRINREIHQQKLEDSFQVSISVGYVNIGEIKDSVDIDGLVELADKALYTAKEKGKNCVVEYTPESENSQ
ncbi:MAG: GGDEF domain-containing protein [Lachnospiraceae bacterium]|nr:GGDEF domain-containing protein [Lachnospiraceae bacterium]